MSGLESKLKSKMKTLILLAPEYGRISRASLQQYEKNKNDGAALMKSIEFNIRERLCYEWILWIEEALRPE